MTRVIRTCCLTLALLVAGAPSSTAQSKDEKAVSAVVRGSIDRILELLQDETLSLQEQREGVKDVIEKMADLELLAKLSLGKTQWSKIDAKQRETFTELFVETIRQSVYEKLELFTNEVVEVGAPEPIETSGSQKYRIVTWIVSKGERTEVAFMLAKRADEWRVYDLEIEGVSTRKSYGSQYADFLREKSFDDLLAEMREKIETAKKKMAEIDAKEEE